MSVDKYRNCLYWIVKPFNFTLALVLSFIFLMGCGYSQKAESVKPTNETRNLTVSPTIQPAFASQVTKQIDDLIDHQDKWKQHNLKGYDFVVSYSTPGVTSWAAPVQVQVRDGRRFSIKPVTPSDTASLKGYDELGTIDDVFAFAQANIMKEKAVVQIVYNKDLDYPESIRLNLSAVPDGKGGSLGVDAGGVIKITELKPIIR